MILLNGYSTLLPPQFLSLYSEMPIIFQPSSENPFGSRWKLTQRLTAGQLYKEKETTSATRCYTGYLYHTAFPPRQGGHHEKKVQKDWKNQRRGTPAAMWYFLGHWTDKLIAAVATHIRLTQTSQNLSMHVREAHKFPPQLRSHWQLMIS